MAGIAGVNAKWGPAETGDLGLRGHDDDALPVDLLDHPGGELLVAAAEQKPLAADRRDHDAGILAGQQLDQRGFVGVGDQAGAGPHDVHSQQRLLESEQREDRACRGSGADQPSALAEHAVHHMVGDRFLRRGLASKRARLGALDVATSIRNVEEAVQPGRHRAGAQQRLIDVHHLGAAQPPHSVLG